MPPSVRNARILAPALVLTALAACHREQAPVQGQRIAFDRVPSQGEQPLASPDTTGANWTVSHGGQAIDFGNPGERPLVTLECKVNAQPPQVTVIRHAPARPNEKALFPVIGNARISRFSVDATLAENEWRWQQTLPADDPLLDVFDGSRALEATLPGGGTVKIGGSGIPGQFVAWCRHGGSAPAVVAKQASQPGAASGR